MTDEQIFAFKYAMVRQAVYYAEELLPPEEEDDGERGCISVARSWLEQPTPEVARDAVIFATMEGVDGGLRYFDYDPLFIEPVEAAGVALSHTDIVRAARHARNAAGDQHSAEALRWQLDSARAILHGEDVPPLPQLG
jgi:hypothetical protein